MNGWQHSSLALLTDLYQLTMAHAYWKSGTSSRHAAFHLFYRKNPFRGGFSIAAGLETVVEFLQNFRFTADDTSYLRRLSGNDGSPLFDSAFLDCLSGMEFECDVDAIPEGTVVFANEPLVRITGPIMQCQVLETALLNIVNFQTLIATKAARICHSARGEQVLEFGLRRAQGIDGALAASRAAYLGGCAATSNVLAGKVYGIPVRGTHAHSWVMSFDTERDAFQAYAEAMPNNCVFLVDTYDTLDGVRNAIEVGKWLRAQGREMVGIRLDSGDLAYLSIEARKLLDAAGFEQAVIVASNDLDENIIASLKEQGAQVNVWGVGTRLVTAYDQPALGGVYKLAAIREPGREWRYKLKLSEQVIKISTPGIQQVRRFEVGGIAVADAIYDTQRPEPNEFTLVDPLDFTRRKTIPRGAAYTDLLAPVFRAGKLVYRTPPLEEVREHAQAQLGKFHGSIKRLMNPHEYPVGLELGLHQLKTSLIFQARGFSGKVSLQA